MNKFEQLIEYVINDEEAKARELFHDIVVEKSRAIYEEMMQEEDLDEAESTEDEDEHAEKAGRKVTKDIEYDDKKDRKMREGEYMGNSQSADLIDDVEAEEQGIGEAEEEVDVDMEVDDTEMGDMSDDDEMGDNEELEDRVVDLEDKLDTLMAEFEELMGQDSDQDSMDMDMDAEEVVDDEMETEGYRMSMEENVQLKAAPAPVKSEESSVNKKAVYAVDSGARGAVAKPSNLDQGGEAQGRAAPTAKDAIGKVGNTPAQSTQEPKPATKPHLAQATGVNTKSVIQ